jgi:hypothetical protein
MTSELSVFQVEADLRKQVRDLLDPMLEHHEKGQERLKAFLIKFEELQDRVELLEVSVF